MKPGALCFLIVLTGCAVGNPPTGPERAVVQVTEAKRACGRDPSGFHLQVCSVYVILDDHSVAHLIEVRDGVPYIEPGAGRDVERYALWLGRMEIQNRHVVRYVGPFDEGYDLIFYTYLGTETTDRGI